jgi:hypothetical protein
MSARAALAAGTLAVLASAAAVALPAGAAPGGGGCQLAGNAKFVKGPNSTDHPFTYTFTGTLSNCQSNESGAPSAGTIATLVPAKGSGTCTNGKTSGVSLVKWSGGKQSVIKYTTDSAAAEVVLQGTVIPSFKVGRKVYRSTLYNGDNAVGDLIFQADPTQCAGSGVTSAPISGFTGIGHQS